MKLSTGLFFDQFFWLVLEGGPRGLKQVRIFSLAHLARKWLANKPVSVKSQKIFLKIRRLYQNRQPIDWDLLDSSGLSLFQKKILRLAGTIKTGQTMSYKELAGRAGYPGAARAAGQALKRNPWPVLVPCHRVVGQHSLGGYLAGRLFKRKLLNMEKALKIKN